MSLVVFLSGETMNDALGAIGRSYASMFDELGHDFVEIRLADPDSFARADALVRKGNVELLLTFVGMGLPAVARMQDGKEVNYWRAMNVPVISLFGDTPAYFFDRHVMPSEMAASLYAFPEHVEFRMTLPEVRGLLGTTAIGPMDVEARGGIDFARKAKGRLLFLKNGNDPDALMSAWRESLPLRTFLMLCEIAEDLAARMASDPVNRVDLAVDRHCKARGMDIGALPKLRLFLVAQLDDYLRRIKSTLIAKALMDFPVDMYGHNWDHLDFSGRKIRFHDGGDYTNSTALIRDSLGIVDMSPNTGRAPHERPRRAFGLYTLCLTNEQAFFNDNVAHASDFSFAFDPDSIRDKVSDVLSHPQRYVDIGIAAAESFRERFAGPRFGEQLLDIASALRVGCGPRPGPLQPYFGWPPATLA